MNDSKNQKRIIQFKVGEESCPILHYSRAITTSRLINQLIARKWMSHNFDDWFAAFHEEQKYHRFADDSLNAFCGVWSYIQILALVNVWHMLYNECILAVTLFYIWIGSFRKCSQLSN